MQFSPLQYLEIDIATNAGLDKATWAERLAWFEMHREAIEETPINVLSTTLLRSSKEPALVLAGIYAYRDMKAGHPIGYTVGMDATASGLQILSVLINCPSSALLCNVLDAGHCVDAYTEVYNECVRRGLQNTNITRKDAKQALMTHLYGSKAVPREVFGDGDDLATFYAVLDDMLPGANALNKELLSMWDPETLMHSWVLPDGFEANIKVMGTQTTSFKFNGEVMEAKRKINAPQEGGLSLGANIVHSIDGMIVREMVRRCALSDQMYATAAHALHAPVGPRVRTDRKKDLDLLRLLELYDQSGFMSARILEVIDADNIGSLSQVQKHALSMLWESLPPQRFDLLTIHD